MQLPRVENETIMQQALRVKIIPKLQTPRVIKKTPPSVTRQLNSESFTPTKTNTVISPRPVTPLPSNLSTTKALTLEQLLKKTHKSTASNISKNSVSKNFLSWPTPVSTSTKICGTTCI